jgi:hypothetical protein
MAATAWADVQQIGVLRQQADRVAGQLDTVDGQRQRVRAEAERLSARIDSLKGRRFEDAPELQESLRASMGLVQRLVDIERRAAALQARQDSVREQLRLAYDWEIGVLIQKLSRERDPGLLAQLVIYQDEREALGARPTEADLQFGAEMVVNPTDGPEEIRQKMELMQGISARLRAEAIQAGQQLRQLEAEARLRTRARLFADELALFDEHLPRGRALSRTAATPAGDIAGGETIKDTPGDRGGVFVGPAGNPGMAPVALVTVRGAQVRDLRGSALENVGGDDGALQIRRLKARIQEINELQAIVGERAATFRASLDQLLDGRE